jgi:hypothetical protein
MGLRTRLLAWLVCFAFLIVGLAGLHAEQRQANGRKLLYPTSAEQVPETLRPVVRKLLSTDQGIVDAADARPRGIFVRVVTKKYILDGDRLKEGATIGDHPFVFVALPESFYGRSLLQIFSAIGYSAEEILTRQLGEEKVVLVFRWEDKVVTHEGRDGTLPKAWQSAVYPSTWDNLFALAGKMATDKEWYVIQEEGKPRSSNRLELRSARELLFVQGYPDSGRKRIMSSSYIALRDTGGADWDFREILERTMAAAEHFTGDGTSKPTLVGSNKPARGYPEFLGPNRQLAALPELAVIDLGALRIAE